MNIERSAVNTFLIPGRKVLGFWRFEFAPVSGAATQICLSTNEGSDTGPLLFAVEEKADPVALDGEVTLAPGDWNLSVYEQGNGVLPSHASQRLIWTEQIHVD